MNPDSAVEHNRRVHLERQKHPGVPFQSSFHRHDLPPRPATGFTPGFCFFTLALMATFTACAQSFKHDEVLAAKRALEFARVVFLDKDLDKGYKLLAAGGRRYLPLDKFKQAINALHPRGYPDRVTAIEYEPMAGEKAIYIFLTGRNGEEQFTYRMTMEGTADTDYRVLKIDQGGGFPALSNQKRPLKPVISIP